MTFRDFRRGWHAFTRPPETWRSEENHDRPRVGMFAAGWYVSRHVQGPTCLPAAAEISLLSRLCDGRVKACHPPCSGCREPLQLCCMIT